MSKRLKFQTPSPVNYMYQPTMSYTPNASPGQFATPQGQFTPPYIQAPVSSEPPPWALSMIEDIKNIKTSVARIETVEKTVNSISFKLQILELKVSTIDNRVQEVEKVALTSVINLKTNLQNLKLPKIPSKLCRIRVQISKVS